eukprot:g3355.t1
MFQFLDVFSMFAAALYRVMQAVLFMDGAYQLNDRIYASAVQARRRSISSEAFHGRLALMVSVSLALVIGALIAAIYLCMAVPEVTICVVSAVVGSSLLLLVSITSWCEHGSLMTSSVMFAYNIYLCYQVASIRPRAEEEEIPTTMLGLLVPTLSLAYFAISKSPARHLAGRKQNSSDTTDDFEPGQRCSGWRTDLLRPNVEDHRPPTQTDRPVTPGAAAEDPNDFLLRCFVHFLADFYVTSVLAPRVSWLRFNIRAATVFVCLAVYAWTLDGPFGTINGFRMGRLHEQPVPWEEVNAAWGQACLLLDALVKKLRFPSGQSQYRLVPKGSFSSIKVGNKELELYGADGGLSNFFAASQFGSAMHAFLNYMQEVVRFLQRSTAVQLPFQIDRDKVGGFSVKGSHFDQERWTKALKFLLTNLKYLIALVESREFASARTS